MDLGVNNFAELLAGIKREGWPIDLVDEHHVKVTHFEQLRGRDVSIADLSFISSPSVEAIEFACRMTCPFRRKRPPMCQGMPK